MNTQNLDKSLLEKDWLSPEEVKYLLVDHNDEDVATRLALIDKKLSLEQEPTHIPTREMQALWWKSSIHYYAKNWLEALEGLKNSYLPFDYFPKRFFFHTDIMARCLINIEQYDEALALVKEGLQHPSNNRFDHFMLIKTLAKVFKRQNSDIPLEYVDQISAILEDLEFDPLPSSPTLVELIEACNKRNKFENSLFASLILTIQNEPVKLKENLEKFIDESQIGYYQNIARKKIREINEA